MITQKDFTRVCFDLEKLYLEKNRRYENSFEELFKEYGIAASVIRIADKTNRLKYLYKHPDDLGGNESIKDTLKDLANYAILTLAAISNKEAIDQAEDLKYEASLQGVAIATFRPRRNDIGRDNKCQR